VIALLPWKSQGLRITASSRIDFPFGRRLSSQCNPLASEPRRLRGSEAVPVSSRALLLVASRSLVSRGVLPLSAMGMAGASTPWHAAILMSVVIHRKDWHRMKRSVEARCHADILEAKGAGWLR
jgi:hypothetical protein